MEDYSGLADFKLHLIETITDNFSADKKVGSGGYGDVYKAVHDGKEIAVKKLHPFQGLDDKQFHSEVRNLVNVHHKNVVRLIGYCYETRSKYITHNKELVFANTMERVICFEFMQGGSLDQHITDEPCGLGWSTCYDIIKGTCEGLNHLHSAQENPIYHLNLKPGSILLDKSMMPKIGGLGLSKLVASTQTHKTEMLNGTSSGYMPPEYINKGYVSNKFDVFSLGVIILRMMAGKKGYFSCSTMPPTQFIDLVTENWKERLQAASKDLSPKIDILRVRKCVEIALRCVDTKRRNRPTIQYIVVELEELEADIKKIVAAPSAQSNGQVVQTGSKPSMSSQYDEQILARGSKPSMPPQYDEQILATGTKPSMLEQCDAQVLATGSKPSMPSQYDDQILATRSKPSMPSQYDEQILATGSKPSVPLQNEEQILATGSKPSMPSQYDEQILATGSKPPLPLQYLKDITNNFCDKGILGKGGFGVVYKGVLHNGEMVAVKKLLHAIPSSQKQFENEVKLLMKLEHQNIVRLVGYCYETQHLYTAHEEKSIFAWKTEALLCLECLHNGSLDKYISDASSGLDWHARCKIIEGISYGLQYLHEHSNEPIVHLDLKPANILLDVNMGPKITDFGLSRLFDQNQTIHTAISGGTLGYMPPEFLRGMITPMYDIFSLGVIILEVITGHRDYPDDTRKSSDEFIKHELQNWRNRLQTEPLYTSLENDCQQIERYIQIGLICVNPERTKRPKMRKIINMLQGLESMNWYIANELSGHSIRKDP